MFNDFNKGNNQGFEVRIFIGIFLFVNGVLQLWLKAVEKLSEVSNGIYSSVFLRKGFFCDQGVFIYHVQVTSCLNVLSLGASLNVQKLQKKII